MNWFVDFLIRLAQRTPFVHIPGYMNRWWLIPYTKFPAWVLKWFPFLRWIERKMPALRIHELLRSDNDRHLHDHPWPFVSVILRGGYWEERPLYDRAGLYTGCKVRWYGPGSILFRKATDFHLLRLPSVPAKGMEPQHCWTLFLTFAYQQKWGYLVHPAYKLRYEEYHKLHPSKDAEVQAYRAKPIPGESDIAE